MAGQRGEQSNSRRRGVAAKSLLFFLSFEKEKYYYVNSPKEGTRMNRIKEINPIRLSLSTGLLIGPLRLYTYSNCCKEKKEED